MAMNQSFSFSIVNKGTTDKNVCLFQGIIPTLALALDKDQKPVLTNANVKSVQSFGFSDVDAILTDGVSPMFTEGKGLEIPDSEAEGAECIIARSANPKFSIESLKSYLKSGGYIVTQIIATATTQGQFNNPINTKIISPSQVLKEDYIDVTRFADPNQFNTTKVVIPTSLALQADTFISWVISAGETVKITLVFQEQQ